MAHQRKLIRQAVVAMLTNVTAAGARVKDTRVDPIKNTDLPVISVYTLSEDVDDTSSTTEPRELLRRVDLQVRGWVAHTDAVSASSAMDDLAEQIESVMDADRYLGSTAAESILAGTEVEVIEGGSSDPLIGIVTLTYTVTYRTSPAAPTNLGNFVTVGVEHRIVGAVDANAVNDQFQEPQ